MGICPAYNQSEFIELSLTKNLFLKLTLNRISNMVKMETEKYIQQMRQIVSQIETLPEECWEELGRLTKIKVFSKNSYFAEAGQFPTELGFICEGTFRAFYRTEEGSEYNKTFFGKNDFIIALTSIVTSRVNLIYLQAMEDSIVLSFDYNLFSGLFDKYHSVERLVRKSIEIEWAKKETREIRLVLNNASERYKFFLEEHPGLEDKIPQYHIASYLGITPIQLSRIRAKKG